VARNVYVLVGYGGAIGIGESSPDEHWGETPENVLATLQNVDLGRLNGPFDLQGVLELLPKGAARCALDIALHDLAATLAGVSVTELLGVQGRHIPPTSVTVSIASPEEMVKKAEAFADHPIIKTKVGFDGDVEAIRAMRKVFSGTLRVDANMGWSPEQAIERLQALEEFDIELCEQPIHSGQLDDLKKVTEATSIPVYADEDVSDSEDVAKLVGVVDGVNLKLRKTGGLREAARAVAVARAHGLGVMLGCDLESGVAATAQASISPLMDKVDIDGPLILAEDPYPGVTYDKGIVSLPAGPGLGVKNKPDG
jgi:L-alanine-DL-glutamate epimerase-like enolase superfamily enzyme